MTVVINTIDDKAVNIECETLEDAQKALKEYFPQAEEKPEKKKP